MNCIQEWMLRKSIWINWIIGHHICLFCSYQIIVIIIVAVTFSFNTFFIFLTYRSNLNPQISVKAGIMVLSFLRLIFYKGHNSIKKHKYFQRLLEKPVEPSNRLWKYSNDKIPLVNLFIHSSAVWVKIATVAVLLHFSFKTENRKYHWTIALD